MSSSRALCCLPSVKKQKHDFFFFVQCIIKQLLDSVFVISRIIKVSVRVISLSLRLRLITLTSTLIILDITKTSSNNCLLLVCSCMQSYYFLMHLSDPESQILESDWLIARAPAVRIFPSGPRVRTATNFPAFASFPAVFFSLQRT